MSDYVASITRGEETLYFETFADANAAAQSGDTIRILVDEISSINGIPAGVTVQGVEGKTTVTTKLSQNLSNITIKNIKFAGDEFAVRYCYVDSGKTATFDNCEFLPTGQYGIHFDGYPGGNLVVKNSTITGTVALAAMDSITFENNEFAGRSSVSEHCNINFYSNATITNCTFTDDYCSGGKRGILSLGDENQVVELNGCSLSSSGSEFALTDVARRDYVNVVAFDTTKDTDGEYTAGTFVAGSAAQLNAVCADDLDVNFLTATNYEGTLVYAADNTGKTVSLEGQIKDAITVSEGITDLVVKEELAADVKLPEGTNLTLDNGVAEGVKIYLPYEPGSEEEAEWIANNPTVPAADIQTFVAMIGDTGYYSFADANAAAQSGDTIKLLVSELTKDEINVINLKAGVTLEGVEGCTTIHGQQGGTSFKANVVIKNIIFSNPGGYGLRNCYSSNGPVSFENCTFDAWAYGVHFDGLKNDVSFTDCNFKGWNSFADDGGKLYFTNCTFDTGTDFAELRPYGNAVMTGCSITEAFIEKGKSDDMGLEITGSNRSFQINNCKVVDAQGNPSTQYTAEDAVNYVSDTSAFVIDGVQDEEGKYTAGKVIVNKASTAKNFVAEDISYIPDSIGAISYDIDNSTLEVKGELAADITLPEGTNLTLDNGVAEGVKIYLPYEPGSEEEAEWIANNPTVPAADIQTFVAMIGDTGYYSFEDARKAAKSGDTIKLLVSELTKNDLNVVYLNEGVTLEGLETGTTIKGQSGGASFKANVVIKNITFSNPGGYGLRNCYCSNGPVSFENCTFDAYLYSVHFDQTANDLSFTNCTLKGWNSFGTGNGTITFTGCSFDEGKDYAILRPYVNTVLTDCVITEGLIEKGGAYGWGVQLTGSDKSIQFNDCEIVQNDGTTPSTKYTVADALTLLVDSNACVIDGEKDDESGKFTSGRVIARELSTVNSYLADEIKIDFLSDENYQPATGETVADAVDYTATASGKTLSLGGTVTNSVNVPADVVITNITLEDGAHLTLNSKDGLAAGDYAFGPDSIIFINDNMSAEEIAAWKTAHGIDESVELLPLAGGIGAPEADTVVPVSATEQNSYKSHIVNLGDNETLTEDMLAPAAEEIIGQETEGGVTTTFINPVGTIFLNNQAGGYTEVRGNVTQESADEAIVVNNVTAAADADFNGGFATVAGDMNITGNFTAVNRMIIRNGEDGTMTMRDTVMEKEGYLLEAQNIEIFNDGHMGANIKATGTIVIHNNSTDTITGVIDGVEITIDGTGRIEDAKVIAVDADGNGELTVSDYQLIVNSSLTTDTFYNDGDTVMDKDSVITYNVEFINEGTITVDMTGATDVSYLIVNNLSGDNVKIRDFDDISLINNEGGYMLTVLNRQNLVALKTGASQEVLKVSKDWSNYEVGEAIEGQEGFIYGFNAFSNLNDANRGMVADTVTIDAVDHTATEGLSERINVIDRALTFTGSSNLPATGELAISTDGESNAAAIFAAGSDYKFSKVTFVEAAGKNSLFIGSSASEDTTVFGVGTIADTVGDTVSIENATVTAGSYTVNGTDNTISDVEMTAENLNVASGAIFAVSDSSLTATDASSNAGTIRLNDSIFTAAALENNGTIILNGTNMIDAELSGTGTIEISTDAVIGTTEIPSAIADTGSNSLIFKGTATIVGDITVGSDILLDRSGAETEVDVTGTLLTNGNFTLGGDNTFEDYLYVDGLGSMAGSLNGNLVISEDCEVALTNGATLTYADTFTNNGKVTYSVKSPTQISYTLIDYVGNGVKTIDDYDLTKITLSKSLKDYTIIVSDSDLVAAKIDTSAIHVDAEWAGRSKGDIVKDAQNNEYVYGYNAYAQLAEFIPTFTGGSIIAHEAGNVAATETTAGEGIEINNPGTYDLSGTEWTKVGYLQLNSQKEHLSSHVVVNIDDSNLVATKIQARRDADYVITDSHLDFENVTSSRGYTCIYANSTLTLTNSVYGYNHYLGNSSAIVAGRAGIVEDQIKPTDNYGKTAVQIDGKLIANNSTLFTVTGDDTVGFGVQDTGYVELTGSVLYAGAIAIGVNQTDAKKKSENTGVDVATLVLDNSVQISQNADNYKIEVGKEVAGALIVRNNSLIDRADAPMTVSGGSSLDISSSTVKVSSLTNSGAITLSNGATLNASTIANTGTINVTGNGNTISGALTGTGAGSVIFTGVALDNKISLTGSTKKEVDKKVYYGGVRFLGTSSIVNPTLTVEANYYVGTYGLAEAADSALTINGDVTFNGNTYVGADDTGTSGQTATLDIAEGKTLTVTGLYARASSQITVNAGSKLLSGYGNLQGTLTVDGGVAQFTSVAVKHNMLASATNGGVLDLGYTESQDDRLHTYNLSNGSILTVGNLYDTNVAITMDSSSTLALAPQASQVAEGTKLAITINVDSAFTGVKKLIDMNARYDYTTGKYTTAGYDVTMTVGDYSRIVTNWNDIDNFVVLDNDLYLSTIDTSTLYVNAAWAEAKPGEMVEAGKYYGINAFSTSDAMRAAITEETTNVFFSAGNQTSYGDLGIEQDVTISTVGEGEALLTKFDINDKTAPMHTVTVAEGSNFRFNFNGTNALSRMAKLVVDGTLTFDWVSQANYPKSEIVVNKTGRLIFENNSVNVINDYAEDVGENKSLTVYGTMRIGTQGEYDGFYPKVAGSEEHGGTTIIDGKDGAGVLTVYAPAFTVACGYASEFIDTGKFGILTLKNGGKLISDATKFYNGVAGVITLTDASTFTVTPSGASVADKYPSGNAGMIAIQSGSKLSFGSMADFVNVGTISVSGNGSEFAIDALTNNGTIELSGASKLAAGAITGDGTLKFDGATINNAIEAAGNKGVFTGTNAINADLNFAKNNTSGAYDQGYTTHSTVASQVTVTNATLTAKNYYIGNDVKGGVKDTLILDNSTITSPAPQDNTTLFVRGSGVVQANGASIIGTENGIFNIMDYGAVTLTGGDTEATRTKAYFDGFVVYGVDYDEPNNTEYSSAAFTATNADITVRGTLDKSHCNQYTIVDGFTTAVLVGGKDGKGDGALTLTNSTFTVDTNLAIGFAKAGTVTMSDGSTLSVANGTIGIGLGAGTGTLTVDATSSVTANAITFGDNGLINLTIKASALTETTYTLIDITGTDALDTTKITVNGDAFVDGATYGDYTLKLWDGDVMLFKTPVVDPANLYVNAAWAGKGYAYGEDLGDGKYYGINAFEKMEDVTGKILTDGQDTKVHILSDLTPASSLEFQYGDGNVSFVKDGDAPVSVAFAGTGDFVFVTGTDATIMIGEGVTFSTYNNQSDFAVYDGPSLSVYGTISGGANYGALYVFDGDHVVHTTGTIGTGRIHSRLCSMTINGIEVVEGVEKRRYAADVAVADRNADAQVAVNFIFNCSGVFSASDTYITVGNLATGGDGHGVYDTNKGGVQDSGTQSSFTLTNTKLETCLIALSKADTEFSATGSVINVTNTFSNAGIFKVVDSTLTVGTTLTNTGSFTVSGTSLLTIGTLNGTIMVDGNANLTGSSVGGAGNIEVAAGKVLTVGDATETATSFGAVTNDGEIDIDGALVNLGAITNNGTINMDWQDKLTFSGFTGSAINFNMTDYTGVETATKVLDYTGTGTMDAADYQAMLGMNATDFNKYFEVGTDDDANDLFLKVGGATKLYVGGEGTGHYAPTSVGLSDAVTAAKGLDAELTVINGTFSDLAVLNDVVTLIEDGTFSKNIVAGQSLAAASARKKVTVGEDEDVNTNLTINSGTYQYVYGADRLTLGSLDHFGSVNLTINGGMFNKAVVGGIAYAQTSTSAMADLIGDINMTITGGTFKEYVYGGCIASSKNLGAHTTIEGDITMTIDVAGDKTVTFEKNIIVGSMGSGYVSKNLDTGDGGNVELVLTGNGTINLSGETSQIWGGCSSDQYFTNSSTGARRFETNIEGNRTLTFTGFTGTLNCNTIRGFNVFNATESNFMLNDGVNLNDIINWDISADSTISGNFYSNFAGDTLNVDLANWDNEAKAIFDDASKFSGMDENLTVTFGDAVASYQDGVWTAAEAGVKLYLEDNKVMLGIA